MAKLQRYLKIKKGDITPFVFLVGDPGRIQIMIRHWDIAQEVAYYREFLTYTGKYKGIPISVTSTGIGCPSTAIAVEELANCGARTFLKVGTCSSLTKKIKFGELIVPDKSVCYDCITREYGEPTSEVIQDQRVYQALLTAAEKSQKKIIIGTNRTHDAYYESGENFLKSIRSFGSAADKLISTDLECSVLFKISQTKGLSAGAILAVNKIKDIGEITKNPDKILEAPIAKNPDIGLEDAVLVAHKAIEILNNGNNGFDQN